MTTTITIPTPPSWIDIDSIVKLEIRRRAFELVHTFSTATEAPAVDVLEEGRALCRRIDQTETAAFREVDTTGCEFPLTVSDGALAVLSNYTGSLALHNAMMDHYQRFPEVGGRFDPDEFMRPAEVKAGT